MIVGKAIYYLLTNATDVTDVVGTRIYPEVAQQDADLPYIVYNVTNNEPTDTKPEPSKLDTAQVEVNIYSDSYRVAIDLAVAVRAALDRVKGTYAGVDVQSIQYLNEVIDFDEPQRAYNINADYDVRISRSGFEIAQGSPITLTQLGALSDVDVDGVTNGQLIAYNSTSGNWEAADNGGGVTQISALNDVTISSLQTGHTLIYNHDGSPRGFFNGFQTLEGLSDTNISSPSNQSFLRYVSGEWIAEATVIPSPIADTNGLSEGSTNLYFTNARVSANTDVSANTAKVGITTQQASDITANNAKVSYTDAAAVAANTAKTSFPGFGTSASTALAGDTTTITATQASAITANTAKTGITTAQADAISANTAKISYTDASAVAANTAKNTYPSADASKLAGIETGADVTDATNVAAAGALMASSAQLTGNLDVQANEINTTTSNGNVKINPNGTGCVEIMGDGTDDGTTGAIQLNCSNNNHGIKIQSPAHSYGATYTLTLPTSDGNANQVLKTDGSGALSWTNQSTGGSLTAYDYDAFTTSANVTINTGVSVASSKIVDIMGDALAAKNNANAKKFLGFHTGSGVCVLQGMVNASGSISGATAGSALWLGASGAFSASAPSTADEYSRIVGYFVGTMQGGEVMCYFNPSQDWVQID